MVPRSGDKVTLDPVDKIDLTCGTAEGLDNIVGLEPGECDNFNTRVASCCRTAVPLTPAPVFPALPPTLAPAFPGMMGSGVGMMSGAPSSMMSGMMGGATGNMMGGGSSMMGVRRTE
jgi:hypothetical protein